MKQTKHWQDPVNALLGAWMALSPWVLGFSMNRNAMASAVISGIVVAALALWVLMTDEAYSGWRHHSGAAH